jgi:hypothetical protein
VVNFNEWSHWRLEWFAETMTMNLLVDNVIVWYGIDYTEKAVGHDNTAVGKVQFFAWNFREAQIDNIKIRPMPTPRLPASWSDSKDAPAAPHTVDFDAPNIETPDLSSAPWTTLSGTPEVITGSGTNNSNVLHVNADEWVKMDIPVASQHATGTLNFDAYIPSGGRFMVQVQNSVGWMMANMFIGYGWNTKVDVTDNFLNGANGVGSVASNDAWSSWQFEWFGDTKTMNLTVDGAPVWTGIDWTEKSAGHPGGAVTQVRFYAWNVGNAQIDNIVISQYQGTETTRTISGNVGASGVTLSGFPGDPVVSMPDGSYSADVPMDTGGVVVPTSSGFVFTPVFRSYGPDSNDLFNEDYTAEPVDCAILHSLSLEITGDIIEDCVIDLDDLIGMAFEWF